MAAFVAKKLFQAGNTPVPNGYGLWRDGEFFATIRPGVYFDALCFTDLNDEQRGRKVRRVLKAKLGFNMKMMDMLPIIRQEYA
jgi:hypothetical protein